MQKHPQHRAFALTFIAQISTLPWQMGASKSMAFLVFEGVDGAGKSSLIQKLIQELKNQSITVDLTREPGGTELGEELRQILLRTTGDTPVPRTELLLYEAIRAQHVEKRIRPKLDAGQWVISDRFTASSIAFQGGGRAITRIEIEWLNDFATHGLKPDLTVLLDLPVEESLKRIQKRIQETGVVEDRFEQEQKSFHQAVRDTYLSIAKENKSPWLVLDAAQTPEVLYSQLKEFLLQKKFLTR